MFELPVGKALVAVETDDESQGCTKDCAFGRANCQEIACLGNTRKDKKDVVFKIIDLPKLHDGRNKK